MSLADTIAAISTPIGEGGLAVIRLSGAQALAVADRCFQPGGKSSCRPGSAPTHTIQYGHIQHGDRVIDEVLVSVLRAPRTFTREDVVEISCHGGLLASKEVLDTVLAAGARLAEPGEFTKRAFLSGRLDLLSGGNGRLNEYLIAPNDRRARAAAGNLHLPLQVLGFAPGDRRITFGRDTIG